MESTHHLLSVWNPSYSGDILDEARDILEQGDQKEEQT